MIDFDRYGKRRELNDLLAYDKFVLFGAGGASYLTVNYLKQRCHKHVICFIDNNPNKWNTSHLGIDILSPAKLKALIDNNTAIIISSVSFQSEIAKQLTTGIGIEPDRIFPYINELVAKHYDNYYLFSNAHLLDDLLDKLADQDSREYFEHIIAFRWTLNPLYLLPNPRMRSSYCYDSLPLFLNRGDIIVDCGAYSGDTAKYFLESLDYDCSIYAIEPFIHNYNALQNWIINNNLTDKVIALHCALGSKSGDAFMHSIVKEPNPTMDAKIISQETKPLNMFEVFEVKIRTLDDLFPDQLSGITFIKMDIEGAEYDAICGASELINIKHPNMMISAYHEPEHLWTIPLKVMDLSDDYLIYAGHQPYAPLEIEYYFYSKKVCR